jgi:phage shock protein E
MEHKLSEEEIQQIKDGRAVLLDVRSDAELAIQSCKFATQWDFDRMTRGIFPNIPKEQPLYVFCYRGNRSAVAQQLLTKEGFSDVHNVGGIHNLPPELCK